MAKCNNEVIHEVGTEEQINAGGPRVTNAAETEFVRNHTM